MPKDDWITTKIPILMMNAIDKFLKTDIAKKNGVFSRPDFVTRVVASWFARFEKEFGIFFTEKEKFGNTSDAEESPFEEGKIKPGKIKRIDAQTRKLMPHVTSEQWNRIETDKAYSDGFFLGMHVLKMEFKELKKNRS